MLCLGFCQYCLGSSLIFLGGLFYLSFYLILEFGVTSGGTWGFVLFLCSRVIPRELGDHGSQGLRYGFLLAEHVLHPLNHFYDPLFRL